MGRGIRKPRTRRKCGDGAKQNAFFAKMVKTHHVLYQEKTGPSLIRLGPVSPDGKYVARMIKTMGQIQCLM